MNRNMIMNAVNEIIKDYKDGFLQRAEAKCMLDGIITLINHSDIESSAERHNIKNELMTIWYANKED